MTDNCKIKIHYELYIHDYYDKKKPYIQSNKTSKIYKYLNTSPVYE